MVNMTETQDSAISTHHDTDDIPDIDDIFDSGHHYSHGRPQPPTSTVLLIIYTEPGQRVIHGVKCLLHLSVLPSHLL